jgi:hypothetical protein
MKDGELLDEVVDLIRRAHVRAWERARDLRADNASLSDEEWWARALVQFRAVDPGGAERFEALKDEVIAARHRRTDEDREATQERWVRDRAQRVFPELQLLCSARGEAGPISEAQYAKATVATSRDDVVAMLERLSARASVETDPRRRAFLERFAQNVAADLKDVEPLLDPTSVSDEQLRQFSERTTERMRELIEETHGNKDA